MSMRHARCANGKCPVSPQWAKLIRMDICTSAILNHASIAYEDCAGTLMSDGAKAPRHRGGKR
jgi:hypothetical protein